MKILTEHGMKLNTKYVKVKLVYWKKEDCLIVIWTDYIVDDCMKPVTCRDKVVKLEDK